MQIFGVEVNPYELFLILILLLAATGSFDGNDDCSKSKDTSAKQEPESPVRILKFLNQPLVMSAPQYKLRTAFKKGPRPKSRGIFGARR